MGKMIAVTESHLWASYLQNLYGWDDDTASKARSVYIAIEDLPQNFEPQSVGTLVLRPNQPYGDLPDSWYEGIENLIAPGGYLVIAVPPMEERHTFFRYPKTLDFKHARNVAFWNNPESEKLMIRLYERLIRPVKNWSFRFGAYDEKDHFIDNAVGFSTKEFTSDTFFVFSKLPDQALTPKGKLLDLIEPPAVVGSIRKVGHEELTAGEVEDLLVLSTQSWNTFSEDLSKKIDPAITKQVDAFYEIAGIRPSNEERASFYSKLHEIYSHASHNAIDAYLQAQEESADFQENLRMEFSAYQNETDVVLRMTANGIPVGIADGTRKKGISRNLSDRRRLGGRGKGLIFSRQTALSIHHTTRIKLFDRREILGDKDGSVFEIRFQKDSIPEHFSRRYRLSLTKLPRTGVGARLAGDDRPEAPASWFTRALTRMGLLHDAPLLRAYLQAQAKLKKGEDLPPGSVMGYHGTTLRAFQDMVLGDGRISEGRNAPAEFDDENGGQAFANSALQRSLSNTTAFIFEEIDDEPIVIEADLTEGVSTGRVKTLYDYLRDTEGFELKNMTQKSKLANLERLFTARLKKDLQNEPIFEKVGTNLGIGSSQIQAINEKAKSASGARMAQEHLDMRTAARVLRDIQNELRGLDLSIDRISQIKSTIFEYLQGTKTLAEVVGSFEDLHPEGTAVSQGPAATFSFKTARLSRFNESQRQIFEEYIQRSRTHAGKTLSSEAKRFIDAGDTIPFDRKTETARVRAILEVAYEEFNDAQGGQPSGARLAERPLADLIAGMESADTGLRRQSAIAVGLMGKEGVRAAPALMKRLNDEEAEVRKAAARSLGQIGAGAIVAVPALAKRAVEDADIQVQELAAEALLEIDPQGMLWDVALDATRRRLEKKGPAAPEGARLAEKDPLKLIEEYRERVDRFVPMEYRLPGIIVVSISGAVMGGIGAGFLLHGLVWGIAGG
ncbi:MAG TPA: HEAT repeat domain-containing protein, partial [Candidatus Omnitrophota bacterium]|nr:HEAT repeat domain-containing protein [Candidatus Omnitrophota bacterium]